MLTTFIIVTTNLDIHQAVQFLQHHVGKVMNWFTENLFKTDVSKTKQFLLKKNKKKRWSVWIWTQQLCYTRLIVLTVCVLRWIVLTVKYLEAHSYSDLSWATHFSYICGRLGSVMSFAAKKLYLLALAYSIILYGIAVFGNWTEVWQTKIDRALKNLLKSVRYRVDISTDRNILGAQ